MHNELDSNNSIQHFFLKHFPFCIVIVISFLKTQGVQKYNIQVLFYLEDSKESNSQHDNFQLELQLQHLYKANNKDFHHFSLKFKWFIYYNVQGKIIKFFRLLVASTKPLKFLEYNHAEDLITSIFHFLKELIFLIWLKNYLHKRLKYPNNI